ncbi:MAG TPA: flagellar hook-basal body complex protein FliE [Egibacteraceae bacterium]
MALPPIPAIGSVFPTESTTAAPETAAPGFADALRNGLQQVSSLERSADTVAETLASGGDAEIHDLMTATSKAQLSVDLLVQVRNRAVEAYQEIMRLQV